jgi:citronellol/citronellal dehydrogenase
MLSPPLDMAARWFAPHTAYSIAKYGMSLCVLGMAAEFRGRVAINALWPRTAIATSAIRIAMGGEDAWKNCRKPEILADAAITLFKKDKDFGGHFLIDDTFLYDHGVRDFDAYRVDPSSPLAPDFFVPEDASPPPGVSLSPVS